MAERVLGVGIAGTTLTELERRLLEEWTPYGVVLFARNVGTATELEELCGEIKRTGDPSPLIFVDQEGGRVDRLRDIIPGIPGAAAVAESDAAEEVVGRIGELIGDELRHFSIDVNLAPVVDVERDEPVQGLERRIYGKDPELVTNLASRFLRGLHSRGVAACLKHFPGMGAGIGDPHYGASVMDVSAEELRKVDLAPYSALANEARAVMIGHGIYPQVDPGVPATLSRKISNDILRNQLGFDGVAISDDMEMHAVSDLGSFEAIKERALLAGNDVVFFCSQVERMPDLIRDIRSRLEDDQGFAARFDEAAARADAYRDHVLDLQRKIQPAPGMSFERIRAAVEDFCNEFEETCGRSRTGERRATPRTPGTGRTGREEWT